MADNIGSTVLHTVVEDMTDDSKFGYVIRVIQWTKDNEPIGRKMLHKQELKRADDGEVRAGKTKGLNADDLKLIIGQAAEIFAALA